MNIPGEARILATALAQDFLGRTREYEQLLQLATADEVSRGVLLLGAPGAGLSELMRQVYDHLFRARSGVIPIYFGLRSGDLTAGRAARRFRQEFLTQAVAFLRSEPEIIYAAPGISELADLSRPFAQPWLSSALEFSDTPKDDPGELMTVTRCFSAPFRAAAAGHRCFVMIDDVHESLLLGNGGQLADEFDKLLLRPNSGFVFGARRRFEFHHAVSGPIGLDSLSFADAGKLVETVAARHSVKINDQTRDLIAVTMRGNPWMINSFVGSAAARENDLQSFRNVSRHYADELISGNIGRHYDELLKEILPEAAIRTSLFEYLFYTAEGNAHAIWAKPPHISDQDYRTALDRLNIHEIVDTAPGRSNETEENFVLSDYAGSRYRLMVENKNPGAVVGEILTGALKRAPELMARHYRRLSAIGLRDILAEFDCQEIPAAILDYGPFRDVHKGDSDTKILSALSDEADTITLPQIVHTENATAFYSAIGHAVDVDRSAVGIGFDKRSYTNEDQVAWLAAELDSKLEATRELAESWCDRLEMVALAADFKKYKVWLIASEGFDDEAVQALESRGAIGSSRKQVELLIRYLRGETASESSEVDEYEIVVPMGDDTELIAAHAVEEVAKRRNFPPKAINQIKTALVEACINAAEHSLSPERKIYQKFTVDEKKIVITVSNRGIRLTDRLGTISEPVTGRRGWGLNLMKGLMDEVKIEQVDDGTRISMTKYLEAIQ